MNVRTAKRNYRHHHFIHSFIISMTPNMTRMPLFFIASHKDINIERQQHEKKTQEIECDK